MDKKVEHQIELERLFNKNQTVPRVIEEFVNCEEIDFKSIFEQNDIPTKFGFTLLAQLALHKRADINTICGIMHKHATSMQETIDLIKLCAELDLIDYNTNFSVFITKYTISNDVQTDIDRYQYPLPMVVKQKEVKCNTDNGYLTSKGSLILQDNHHDDDICLDHINRANKIRFKLNKDIISVINNSWSNLNKRKSRESVQDYQKRISAFEHYNTNAHAVMDLLIQEGNEFYLTHKYDKRGRVYSQGYHVNYQGNSWNKAVIDFAEEEIVE